MPETKVRSPSGEIITVRHPEGATDEQILNYARSQSATASMQAPAERTTVPPPSVLSRIARGAAGTAEVAASLGTGFVGGLFGERAASLDAASGLNRDKLADDVASSMTYRPRTEAGQDYASALSRFKPFQALGNVVNRGAEIAGEVTGTGEQGEHTAKLLAQLVPLKIGRLGRVPRVSTNQAVNTARELGLLTDPRQVVEGRAVGTVGQRAAASFGGKAAIPAEGSLRNQPRIQELIAEDFNLPSTEWITDGTVKRLRDEANQKYAAIQSLTNQSGAPYRVNLARDSQYLSDIRVIRADSRSGVTGHIDPAVNALLDKYAKPLQGVTVKGLMDDLGVLREIARREFKSDKPNDVLARATRRTALALENALDRQVGARFPDLISEWRTARTDLARLHSLEDAMTGSEIDPRLLAKARDHGAMLSGNMEKLADVAEVMPHMMQTGPRLGATSSQGLLDTSIAAGAGAAAGTLVAGWPGAAAGGAIGPLAWAGSRAAGRRYALSPNPGGPPAQVLGPVTAVGAAQGMQGNRQQSFYEYLQQQRANRGK